jgi:hypothetical protein
LKEGATGSIGEGGGPVWGAPRGRGMGRARPATRGRWEVGTGPGPIAVGVADVRRGCTVAQNRGGGVADRWGPSYSAMQFELVRLGESD